MCAVLHRTIWCPSTYIRVWCTQIMNLNLNLYICLCHSSIIDQFVLLLWSQKQWLSCNVYKSIAAREEEPFAPSCRLGSPWNAAMCANAQIHYKSFKEDEWSFLPLTYRWNALKSWPSHDDFAYELVSLGQTCFCQYCASPPCVRITFRPRGLWQSSLNSFASAIMVKSDAKHTAPSANFQVTVR